MNVHHLAVAHRFAPALFRNFGLGDVLISGLAVGWFVVLWAPPFGDHAFRAPSPSSAGPAQSAAPPTLDQLAAKPLFDPTRTRYVPPPPPLAPPAPAPPPPLAFEQSHSLRGIARNGAIRIAFVSEDGQAVIQSLKVGDRLGDHVVLAIGAADVTFRSEGGSEAVLRLSGAARR